MDRATANATDARELEGPIVETYEFALRSGVEPIAIEAIRAAIVSDRQYRLELHWGWVLFAFADQWMLVRAGYPAVMTNNLCRR